MTDLVNTVSMSYLTRFPSVAIGFASAFGVLSCLGIRRPREQQRVPGRTWTFRRFSWRFEWREGTCDRSSHP